MAQILHLLYHLLCWHNEGSDNGNTDRSMQDARGRGMVWIQEGNWHKQRISLKCGQELLIPEVVLPPLTGALVLVTPIEFQSDFKHIYLRVFLYDFKVWLRMSTNKVKCRWSVTKNDKWSVTAWAYSFLCKSIAGNKAGNPSSTHTRNYSN